MNATDGEGFRCSDLLERLPLLDGIIVLMCLGDVADQYCVRCCGWAGSDDQLGFNAALAELKRVEKDSTSGLIACGEMVSQPAIASASR